MRLEPTKDHFFRTEIEKNFVCFLVQMKIAKSPFEINWPLVVWFFSLDKIHQGLYSKVSDVLDELLLAKFCISSILTVLSRLLKNEFKFTYHFLDNMTRLLDQNEWMRAKVPTIIQFHQNQDQHLPTVFISRAVVVVLLQIHLPFYLLHKAQYIY